MLHSDIERLERLIQGQNEEVNNVKVKLSDCQTNIVSLDKFTKGIREAHTIPKISTVDINSDIDDMKTIIEQSSKSLRSIERRISTQTDEIESLADKQDNVRDELEAAIADMKSQLENAERTLQEKTKSFNHTERELVKLHEELQSVRDDQTRVINEIAALAISLEQIDNNLKKLIRNVYMGSSEGTIPEEGKCLFD